MLSDVWGNGQECLSCLGDVSWRLCCRIFLSYANVFMLQKDARVLIVVVNLNNLGGWHVRGERKLRIESTAPEPTGIIFCNLTIKIGASLSLSVLVALRRPPFTSFKTSDSWKLLHSLKKPRLSTHPICRSTLQIRCSPKFPNI